MVSREFAVALSIPAKFSDRGSSYCHSRTGRNHGGSWISARAEMTETKAKAHPKPLILSSSKDTLGFVLPNEIQHQPVPDLRLLPEGGVPGFGDYLKTAAGDVFGHQLHHRRGRE